LILFIESFDPRTGWFGGCVVLPPDSPSLLPSGFNEQINTVVAKARIAESCFHIANTEKHISVA
jgi:hypothetical protein